ncbi:hypothetical protein MYOV011v1_p0189 [Vibrio phage 6E35.1a]|nr:hypothetical protein MYOV011v1_p0189 [Vibrio phage 6E35.1a]
MSNSDKTDLVYRHLDFGDASKILNLPDADTAGAPLPKSQIESLLAAKQANVVGGNGVEIDGNSIVVDLGTVTSSVAINGASDAYSRNSTGSASEFNVSGYIDRGIGEVLTSGSSSPYNFRITNASGNNYHFYTRDNGDGTFNALVFGLHVAKYHLYRVTGDPGTFNTVTLEFVASVPFVLPGYVTVDGERYINTDYDDGIVLVGGTDSYMKFAAGALNADVVTDMASAATGKLVDAGVVKTYIDDAKATAIVAANNTFSNSLAGLTGSPSNVQSAIESAASEINSLDSSVSGLQDQDIIHTAGISDVASAVGIAVGSSNMGSFTNTMLIDNSDIKTVLEAIATEIDDVNDELHSKLGVIESDVGMGAMVSPIYSDDVNAKTLIEEAGAAIESLQVGAGAFWAAVDYHHHADSHSLPAGFGDGSTDVGTLVIDPTGSNLTVAELETGDRILVISDGTDTETGIYVVNSDNSTQRSTDAQASADFTTNKTVNIINGGSHAGATYAYVGASDPTIGTDALPFEFKQGTNVGDTTITESKLALVLATKLNGKTDKETATFNINTSDGQGGFTETIAHTLGDDVIVQIETAVTGEVRSNLEIVKTNNQVVVNSNISVLGLKIVIIG